MTTRTATLHGVFMDVMGLGVLLSGVSGVGKSELALELLTRGHRLIADDAPLFTCVAPNAVEGVCPPPLNDFLEVRGLGVINIRAMYGDGAIAERARLQLILHLRLMDDNQLANVDRLRASKDEVSVLGVAVPRITLPVAPGRELAVLTEAAVRNHVLALGGYDAAADFAQRQRRHMAGGVT